jgi:exosortase/archaeosortase family protein
VAIDDSRGDNPDLDIVSPEDYVGLVKPPVLFLFQIIAFWPVWQWYIERSVDGSDDSWGWVALGTASLICLRSDTGARVPRFPWLLPALLVSTYTISYWFFPPLLRAMIAVVSIGAVISVYRFGNRLHAGVCGLLILSLPLMASLQFYLGFPLRFLVAELSALMLRLGGLTVMSEGSYLKWGDKLISIDAPCSGIKMLWAGYFLTFSLACIYRLGFWRSLQATMLSLPLIILGNLFRSVALFYTESGIVAWPGWSHDLIGIVFFLFTGLCILSLIHRINRLNNLKNAADNPLHHLLSSGFPHSIDSGNAGANGGLV